MHNFAETLRRTRIRAGKTQEWMAKELHIHRTTYTKYETGAVEPSLETCFRLCVILHVTPNELLGWKTENTLTEQEMEEALLPWSMCLPEEEQWEVVQAVKAFLLQGSAKD